MLKINKKNKERRRVSDKISKNEKNAKTNKN